jgi:capsular polysaccharide biosynthesis protein
MDVFIIKNYSQYEFFHWFYLFLGSLYRIQDVSGQVYFTGEINNLEFQTSSLKLLEHTFKYVERLQPTDRPIYLEYINLDNNNFPVEKEIYKFLRVNFYEKNTFNNINPLSRLIYISRNKSVNNLRSVLNEDEYIPMLIEIGFEIIYLEDLVFNDKIKIFMEAKLIVTPIGAALSLGFFLNKDAKVLIIDRSELHTNSHYIDIYKELALSFKQYTNIDVINIYSNSNDILHIIIKDTTDFIGYINRYLSE